MKRSFRALAADYCSRMQNDASIRWHLCPAWVLTYWVLEIEVALQASVGYAACLTSISVQYQLGSLYVQISNPKTLHHLLEHALHCQDNLVNPSSCSSLLCYLQMKSAKVKRILQQNESLFNNAVTVCCLCNVWQHRPTCYHSSWWPMCA